MLEVVIVSVGVSVVNANISAAFTREPVWYVLEGYTLAEAEPLLDIEG